MRNLIFVFICLLLVIPCQAEIITVDDDGPADFNNIQAAIDESNDGDEIVIADGTYTGPGNRDIDFLGKAVTVRSEGGPENCIIDCSGTEEEPHRGFNFHSDEDGDSVLEGFTIINGRDSVGAGINCNGASPTIRHCLITGNTSRFHGGGLYCRFSSPVITSCTLRDNTAIHGHGGGIFCLGGSPDISTCIISDNSAGSSGGGLFNNNSSPVLLDCDFIDNSAGDYGGGVCNTNNSIAIMTDCTFSDNRADYCGDDTYSEGEPCIDVSNRVTDAKMYNIMSSARFSGQYQMTGSSGTVYYVNGLCGNDSWSGLDPCCVGPDGPKQTIQAAIDDAEDGETIIVFPHIYLENIEMEANISLTGIDPNDVNIVETTVIDGGGEDSVVKIIDVNTVIEGLTITNGLADANGGGVYCEDSNLTISKCVITGNGTADGEGANDGGYGGGIYCCSASVTLAGTLIMSNTTGRGGWSHSDGGGDGGSGAGIYGAASSLIILDCNITGNTTGSGGGTDCNDGGDGGDGAGIYGTASLLIILDCNITGNTTGRGGFTFGGDGGDGGNGAGIYGAALCLLNIENCAISGNETGDGGIAFDGPDGGDGGNGTGICSTASCLLNIENCVISGNKTGDGGIGGRGHGGDGGDGAGIHCCTATIKSCTISSNLTGNGGKAEYRHREAAKGGDGGGIYCASGVIEVEDCEIAHNKTGRGGRSKCNGSHGGDGAGIYCASSAMPTIVSCTVANNTTGNGSGTYSGYHETVGGNGGNGGGIFCYSGTVSNCAIMNNITGNGGNGDEWPGHSSDGGRGGSGGGIYCSSAAIFTNCLIAGNRTGDGGDGSGYAGDFYGGDGGSGAGIFGPSATVANCTIAQNIAGSGGSGGSGGNDGSDGEGAGAYADSNTVITNSIVWGSSPDQLVGQDCNNVTYCDIGGSICSGMNGNISADPCFVDPNNPAPNLRDYHLLSSSPCINTGDPNHPIDPNETDIDGQPRVIGGRIDMGADEVVIAAMRLTPPALNPFSQGKWIKAHLVLPEGFAVEDVDENTPALLEPFSIESDHINVFVNEDGLVEIEAAFDRAAFCEAGVNDEAIEVRVIGSFTNGEYFYGTDTIRIVNGGLKYVAVLASHWLEAGCGAPDWCGGADADRDSAVDFVDFALFDDCCIKVGKD